MANNTISQVEINGTTYDLLDVNTLSALDSLKTRVKTLEDSVAIVKNNSTTDNTYVWDIETLNTTDTWVPVISDDKIQHRNIGTSKQSGNMNLFSGWSGWCTYYKYSNILFIEVWAAYSENINSYSAVTLCTLPTEISLPDFGSTGVITVDGSEDTFELTLNTNKQILFVTRQATYSANNHISGGIIAACVY